jgi:aldehyde dehydrogenase (NAD+)
MDIDAIWCEETASIVSIIEEHSATNLKRTWTHVNTSTDIREFLDHATEKKTVWIPWGEG